MKFSLVLFSLFFFQFDSFAQLDLKSISFDIQKEIPGEIHFPDSVEFKMFLEAYNKSGDLDSSVFNGMECVWHFSHDTSDISNLKNYSIAENIHIGDFNGDNLSDFVVDFSIWGCTAYIGKAYISSKNSYKILGFYPGFITNVSLEKSGVKSVQSKIFGGCMYGFDMINQYEFKNGKPEYKFMLEYLFESDSLMKSVQVEKVINYKKDSVHLFNNGYGCLNPDLELFYNGRMKLKSKKIQVLKTEEKYCLVIIEAFNNNHYESGELKPEKYFVCAWMKREDLE